MKSTFLLAICILIVNAAAVGQSSAQLGETINAFLSTLNADEQQQASYDFNDSLRTQWTNLPLGLAERPGIRYGDLTEASKIRFHDILTTLLSSQGYLKTNNIMHLDDYLLEIYEIAHEKGQMNDETIKILRSLDWGHGNYYVSVWGVPQPEENWAFKFEGHHISLNVTSVDGELSTTPLFLGTDPALVRVTQYAGIRPLSKEEEQIAQLSALNFRSDFRVLNLNNPFNDGRTPYFHKAVGGYHGAKLRRFQELIDFHLGAEVQRISGVFGNEPTQEKIFRALNDSRILNMLNTRYLIYNPGAPPLPNAAAFGSAWIVDQLEFVENADEEIMALDDFDPLYEAVADRKFSDYFEGQTEFTFDSLATVDITSYKPNELTYDFQSNETQLVVFSEIHYPNGWQAYLDGEPVDHARVNYVLRAMKVPAGEHTIVFKYEPEAYTSTARISIVFSIIVLLLAAFGLFRHFRGNRPAETEA